MKNREWRIRKQCGFTLLEMLLVLGLIVVILGLAVPGMGRIYARNQLKSAALEFQGVLYHTRLEAMKTGKPLVFRYRYGSSVFEIIPKAVFDQRKKNQEGIGAISAGSELLEDKPVPENEVSSGLYEQMLPRQIVFGPQPAVQQTQPNASSDAFSPGTVIDSQDIFSEWATDVNGEKVFDDGWSKPVLFFPNGRTSQAVLELRTTGRYNFRQQLTLRGLTGTAQISD